MSNIVPVSQANFNPFNIPSRKTSDPKPPTPPIPILRSATSDHTFQVSEILGVGHTAVVVAVWTPSGVRQHALKIPFSPHSAKAAGEARILKSVQGVRHAVQFEGDFILAPAHFPKTSPYLSFGHKTGAVQRHAIMMSKISGKDAQSMFLEELEEDQSTELSSPQILSIGKQLAETLQDLEARNLIHRDIKPDNIGYTPETDQLAVFDFGFTKNADEIKPGDFHGTPSFAPPEYLLGKKIDFSADMWGLATTLLELYTGDALAPTPGEPTHPHFVTDLCHLIMLNVGPFPQSFIESIPEFNLWFHKDGSLRSPITKAANTLKVYIEKMVADYPGIPIWEARIQRAAKLKGESEEQARNLIDFLRPMLSYERRITPSDVLHRLTFSDTHTQFVKGLHRHETTKLLVPQILTMGEKTLQILHQELHEKGLVHQHVKPENIAYEASTSKTLLYGLSHAKPSKGIQEGVIEGSCSYLSPEQLLGKNWGEKGDVWSLGASLFEVYTGTKLIQSFENAYIPQTIIDLWHIMVQNFGPVPDSLLENISPAARSYFIPGSNALSREPSRQANRLINSYQKIAQEHPHVPLWQARIFAAAKLKGEEKSNAQRLVNFLSRMLRYEERTTAAEALQRLEILRRAEQEEGKTHPLVRVPQLQPRNSTS